MTEDWVLNASPLILLGKLRRLDLLEKLATNTHVPQAVFDEVQFGLAKDFAARSTLEWASVRRVTSLQLPDSIIRWDIGAGESQVIAHALFGHVGLHWMMDAGELVHYRIRYRLLVRLG